MTEAGSAPGSGGPEALATPAWPSSVRLPSEPAFGEPPEDDAFGSEEVAERLAALVLKAPQPYTISISGSWGVGKTTLIDQMLAAMTRMDNEALAVRIDLWSQDIDDLRRTVVVEVGAVTTVGTSELKSNSQRADDARTAIARKLDQELKTSITEQEPPNFDVEVLKNLGRHKLRVFGAALFVLIVASLFAAAVMLPMPWSALTAALIPSLFTFVLVQSGLVLSVTTASKSIAPATERVGLSRELRAQVSSSRPDERVVVVIDNLDRLSGDDSFKALGELRAFLEIPRSRCVFVIPIDRDAFAAHLNSSLHLDDQAARDYLDKFFNLNVLLAKPAPIDLRDWSLRQVIRSMDPGKDRAQAAEIIADAADGSPRAVKRILSGVVARCWLLTPEERVGLSLPQLALLESLAARFPAVIRKVAVTPRLLTEVRATLATATNPAVRHSAVGTLFPDAMEQPDSPKDRTSLLDLLMAHRSVPLTSDQVRSILSLRDDRDWRGVDRPDSIRQALRTGDAAAFGQDLNGRESGSRAAVLSRAIEVVREDAKTWDVGGVNGLNALVPSLGQSSEATANLRSVGLSLIARTTPDQLKSMSLDAVRFLAKHADGDPRLVSAAELAGAALIPQEGDDASVRSMVELIKLVAPMLNSNQLDFARQALARLPPNDLDPVFDAGPHLPDLLKGPIFEGLVATIIKWRFDADNTPAEINLALKRALVARDHGINADEAALKQAATYVGGQVAGVSIEWLGCLEDFVRLFEGTDPSEPIDALATALSLWPAARGDGFRLALSLPLELPRQQAIEKDVGTWLETGPWAEVSDFSRRSRSLGLIERQSTDETLAKRWLTAKDEGVVQLVAEGGDPSISALVRVLDLVASQSMAESAFVNSCEELTDVIVSVKSHTGATELAALIAKVAQRIPAESLSKLAIPLSKLADLDVDLGLALDAVETRIRSAADATTLQQIAVPVRTFAEARIDFGGRLAKALVVRSKELQWVDWPSADWLVRRKGISQATFRDALVAMLRRPDVNISDAVPRLADLRVPLKNDAKVTEAVVVRLAGMPCDLVESLLGQMTGWVWPKHSAEFGQAVLLIGGTCPGLLGRFGH